MIHDLLTLLHRAGVTALDLDPAGNRLRCLPETPLALKPPLAAQKAELLALAQGHRCTLRLADWLARRGPQRISYRAACVLPGGYQGPTGDVHDGDARRLIARLYVLKGDTAMADAILEGDWTHYRAAYGMPEGVPHAD